MLEHIAAGLRPAPQTPTDVENAEIRQKLAEVRLQMDCAEDLFNTAIDEAMLDSCIYKIKSLQVYYSFLVRRLRLLEGEKAPLSCGPAPENGGAGLLAPGKERMMEAMG